MEYGIIVILLLVIGLLLAVVLNFNAKKLKQMAKNETLDTLVNQFPENVEICKSMLKKLDNQTVTIEETKESKTNLYIAISNKIIIANIRDTYTRVQTIAHECLHSVQNRKLLLFNFIYSNFYMVYFIVIILLTLLGKIENTMFQVAILSILGGIYYFVRSYLETDAMIKARYLAKEYIEENNLCTTKECEELIKQYDNLNQLGIPLSNLGLLWNTYVKMIFYCILVFIMQLF